MVWGKIIYAEETDGELREALDEVGQPSGPLPGLVDSMAHNPAVLRAFLPFTRAIQKGDSPLTTLQRQIIATAVSYVNHCVY